MTIMALEKLTRAEQWLAEARTLDELKEIHDIAKAAEAYAAAHRLGVAAENHALEVRLLAARRIGELVPAETKGGDKKSESAKSTPKRGIDIPHQRLSEFRQLASVPFKAFRKKIAEAKARSERISYSRFLDGARSGTWGPILDSNSPDWWTPAKYIMAVSKVMGGIDLDPASCPEANNTVGAAAIFAEKDDGLSHPWAGRVFLNPPYGKLGAAFAAKLYEALGSGVTEAIMLVNSRATDADWFQPCFNGIICFTDHRIDFDSPGEKQTASTHGSCFVYFGPNKQKFAEAFSQFGNIIARWPIQKSEDDA